MDEKMPTVEDIERKQRLLSILFKIFFAILVLIACIFVGWLISYIGYHATQVDGETGMFLLAAAGPPIAALKRCM